MCLPRHPHAHQEHQKAWALNLNGFDVEEAKILRLSGKPQNAPEGETRCRWSLEGGVKPMARIMEGVWAPCLPTPTSLG